ncbi:proprotein convertase P-domain-containing protein [Parasphingorhabdus sp.]|uniref:proprotein convertase P-domain-containing protein n=1 Tax=Parasphingorhabdus sp. TaxID=2709688 RepID=UPI003A909D89
MSLAISALDKVDAIYLTGPVKGLLCLLIAGAILLFPAASHAQTVTTYVNSAKGNINSSRPCTTPLVRNFVVAASFTVSDVDIGVYATHKARGEIRMTLQSPAGTRVQLVNGNVADISGDNFNVLLNDDGTQTVNTDGNTVNHSTTAPPPFQHNFIPNNPLSAFNNENSAGTWRLEICELSQGSNNGKFQYGQLYLTDTPANLSVTKISSIISDPVSGTTNPKRIPGAVVQYCILISNGNGGNADSIVATDSLSGPFTYNPGTMNSGANCQSATTPEDDDAADSGEIDPYHASISGSTITVTASTLAPTTAFALTFQVTIN